MTTGEKFFADNKATATTAIMHENGHKEYAVVEDSAGNKYLYPYVLYAELELAVKKTTRHISAKKGLNLKTAHSCLSTRPTSLNKQS